MHLRHRDHLNGTCEQFAVVALAQMHPAHNAEILANALLSHIGRAMMDEVSKAIKDDG